MDNGREGAPISTPNFTTPTVALLNRHLPISRSILQKRNNDALQFQAPTNSASLSRAPFLPIANKAPLKHIVNRTPRLVLSNVEAFEKIAQESPRPNLSRLSSIASDFSVPTPVNMAKLSNLPARLPFKENNNYPFSSIATSRFNTQESSNCAKNNALGVLEKDTLSTCEALSSVANMSYVYQSPKSAEISQQDSESTYQQLYSTPSMTEDSDISAPFFPSEKSEAFNYSPRLDKSPIQERPNLHTEKDSKASSSKPHNFPLKSIRFKLNQEVEQQNLSVPESPSSPALELEEPARKMNPELYIDEVSLNLERFDTSTEDATELNDTTILYEHPVDVQFEASPKKHVATKGSFSYFSEDLSSDSIDFKSPKITRRQPNESFSHSTSNQRPLPFSKPTKAKKAIEPKKPCKKAESRNSTEKRKPVLRNDITLNTKREKDGFLVTTTRSGRLSHRPVKLWENERPPSPEVSIKYFFMKDGVSITKNGTTNKFVPRGSASKRLKNLPADINDAKNGDTTKAKINFSCQLNNKRTHDKIFVNPKENEIAAPVNKAQKRNRRISLANQSLGMVSPGILLAPKKIVKPKAKNLKPKAKITPKKGVPTVAPKKVPNKSRLTEKLGSALRGREPGLFLPHVDDYSSCSDHFESTGSLYDFSD